MKYRHQYHAGNFADVHKHVLLLEVLRALTRKDKGLLFVDTHAGRGDYDLHPGDIAHPAEWQAGAAKLLAATPRACGARPTIATWSAAGAHGGSLRYPGSPLLAARALRAVDRAVFFETQREEAGQPAQGVATRAARARVEVADGFAGLRALLPPPERRGCVLIDPPYEERADLSRVHRGREGLAAAFRKRGAAAVAAGETARRLRRVARDAAGGDDAAGAGVAAVDASARLARGAQRFGAGAREPALSSRGRDARMAAGVARRCSAAPQSGCEVLATGERR